MHQVRNTSGAGASCWRDLLPLGAPRARATGVNVAAARLVILVMTAILTATATLIVGPLSFVGLMAPHRVRMVGVQRPLPHLFAAAMTGALIMVLADWLGRNMLFPWQVPTGRMATLLRAPYDLWLLGRGGA
ncbi:iron chelate uptake ABC transporter family permease subunit [Azorhizobium sp. AG788]|uniref:iron chelate uptake ABC transporter family permease subunit n=1 Tax=Azorhizobium sp. AG788 TaxID=2183897 RepID=UPI003139F749